MIIIMCVVGLLGLAEINRSVETVTQRSLVKERLVNDWARNIHSGVTRTTAIAKSADASLATFFADEAAASTRFCSSRSNPDRKPRGKELWAGIAKARQAYLSTRDTIFKAKKDGDVATAERVFAQEFLPATRQFIDLISNCPACSAPISTPAPRISRANTPAPTCG